MQADGGWRRIDIDWQTALGGLLVLLGIVVVVGIGSRGYDAPEGYALAVVLIVAGLVLLGRRLLAARRP